jgi:hypothetical protein
VELVNSDGGKLKINPGEVEWLLFKIQDLNQLFKKYGVRRPIHQQIWAGSYDVWSCEQDKIDAIEIPKRRMREAEEAGLIKSEMKPYGKWQLPHWSLTEAGEAILKESQVS